MIRIAYAPINSDYIPPKCGSDRYDFGYSKPLQELANAHEIELAIFQRNQPNADMRREFPDIRPFKSVMRALIHPAPQIQTIIYSSLIQKNGSPYNAIAETLHPVGNLCFLLDAYKPDIVISAYNVSQMQHPCKKILVCHEYWPYTIKEFLSDRGADAAIIQTEVDRIQEDMSKVFLTFDRIITPSKLCHRLLVENHTTPAQIIDLYIAPGDTALDYSKGKYALLTSSRGWFRFDSVSNAIVPIREQLNKVGIDVRIISGLFDPKPVLCGVTPTQYFASEPSKIYMHLACGIPTFVHPNNFEDLKDEVGVHPLSVEDIIRSSHEGWRQRESKDILLAVEQKHGMKTCTSTWRFLIANWVYSTAFGSITGRK
jgi:hypothetical protein